MYTFFVWLTSGLGQTYSQINTREKKKYGDYCIGFYLKCSHSEITKEFNKKEPPILIYAKL